MDSTPTRKEPRTTAVVPVRIYGMDADGKPFNSVVHTLNVSKSGALLANVGIALTLGDLIGVQKGVYKAKFRVQWLGKKGSSSQGQVGIECVDGAKNIWGVEERPHSVVREAAAAQRRSFAGGGFATERRQTVRHSCDIGVQIREQGSEVNLWSRCTDISEGGCYVESRSPLSVHTKFSLILFTEPDHLTIPAEVRTAFPGMGMGVQFMFESADDAVKLRRYLRQKFGGPQPISSAPVATLPALERLAECVEQLKAWAESTALEENDREEVETLAISIRHEILGLRAELSERTLARDRRLVHTSA